MGLSVLRRAGAALLAAAPIAGFAACGEKPQRSVGETSYDIEKRDALADRTRNQGEYQRMAY